MTTLKDLWVNVRQTFKEHGAYIFTMSCVGFVLLYYVTWWVTIDRRVASGKVDDSHLLKLVIDHDGGADDAMAVIMCLLHEKYFNGMKVVGITTTHGNVDEAQAFINSQRFLDLAGRREVPIYRGAVNSLVTSVESDYFFGRDGIGDNKNNTDFEPIKAQDMHAANALVELSKKHEGKLVVMTIGPLTNIALAQKLDPEFIGRLNQLYIGAGHIHDEENSEPEFNAVMDAEAYRIVADNADVNKVTLIPFSRVKNYFNLTKDWRINVLGAIDTVIMQTLLGYERLSLAAAKRWTLLDPAVAALVLEDRIINQYKYGKHNITLCGPNRGMNYNNLDAEDPNMRMIYSASEEDYKAFLVDVFSADHYIV